MELEIKRDGLTLRGFVSVPDTDEFDVVIQFHGFMMDCGRDTGTLMYQVHEYLRSLGFATVRVDFNGHGKSDGKQTDMSVLNELCDANAVLQYVRGMRGVRHIYVLGHSQGGVVGSMLAGYYPDVIDKLVLLAPAATLKTDAQKGVIMAGSYDPKHVPDTIQVKEDFCAGGFYFRTAQTLPIYEVASCYEGPTCNVHAKEDMVVSYTASEKYHEVFKHNELHLLDNGNHSFIGECRQVALEIAGEFFLR